MKKYILKIIITIVLFSSAELNAQELIVKSNLENLKMRVGETFKPTSFAESLQGEKTMCQAVIYYNKKGVFSTAKAITVDRDEGTILLMSLEHMKLLHFVSANKVKGSAELFQCK